MLDKEFKFYKDNLGELYVLYPNLFIIIKDQSVHGAYNTFDEALYNATTKFDLGTFLIQQCTQGVEGYTQTFHSRVIFA